MPETHDAAAIQQVADRLKEFMEARGLRPKDVGKAIDCSESTVYEFCRGRYKGKLEQLVNKVANYMETQLRREQTGLPKEFVDTGVAKKIKWLITYISDYSEQDASIGIVVGDAGCGKSSCLRQYAKANRNAIYVELDATMTVSKIFSVIARQLKIDAEGSLASITERIVNELTGRQTVLILDEASSLNVSMLDKLRQIIVVKSRCPMILAGNNDLLKTINQNSTRRGYESLDQFNSRVMMVLDFDRLAADPKGGLYTVEEIRKLYEYGGVKLSSTGAKRLQQISKMPKSGRFRSCWKIVIALHKYCEKEGINSITAEMVDAAVMELGLPQVKNKLALMEDDAGEQQERMAAAG